MKTDVLAKLSTESPAALSEAHANTPCLTGSPEEQRGFNQTQREYPREHCLPDLLWAQARAQPERLAVSHDEQQLTYRELAARSAALAGYLRHLGVAPDACVGLFVEPSIELMVGAWGVLLSGGAYLPLSPEYPEDRLRYMIEDSRTAVVFCQEKLQARLAELAPNGTRVVTLTQAESFARALTEPEPPGAGLALRPHHLAYIIYTSGSTGKPKGVMIEHGSIVNQLHWLQTVYALGPDKTVLQKTPMSFDAAQWEILSPACGARTVMGSPGVYRDPERLIEAISRHQVTTLQCVPTLLQALLDTERLPECTSLTQLFCGGESLTRTLAQRCLMSMPQCELVNLYGPTECTINSSAFTVDRSTVRGGPSTISIGAPVHNTQYYILDGARAPVPPGAQGELYVGGVQLARGYLHRPDLTADRFVDNPFASGPGSAKLYKTGDLASWNSDGTVQFAGRTDNQVKLRGFRVELDEIRVAIEGHDWVKNAAVIVKNDPRTGFQNLLAFIELNPKEAALMDQGNHGAHHQSKSSKLQVKAQLANMGCRDPEELSGKAVVELPGKTATPEQRRRVFARKTYRTFEGGAVTRADLLRLLGERVTGSASLSLEALDFSVFGELLRYFGQYLSAERLLPKYGYASPGSLYATQMYFELDGIGGLRPGYYYYHPVHHQLVLIREKAGTAGPARIQLHFMGKKRAIQPVYKNNIQEVLEIETGHMVGLFEQLLPAYGLDIQDQEYNPATREQLECVEEDYYLGTFALVPYAGPQPEREVALYVQSHPGRIADLPAGQYQYKDGGLELISEELVLKKHVIAINQQIYESASFGISVISHTSKEWMRYVDLGRTLQHLQMNGLQLGFMSSGYSSKSGNDLPSAKRMEGILKACGHDAGPSYFFVGGRVSQEQLLSEGMREDVVHMKGPAEMIKDDLVNFLPDYMLPNRVMVMDRLPLTANGKIDFKALDKTNVELVERPFVAPRTPLEERICDIWMKVMRRESLSVQDDFFESGGNSLIAVGIVNKLNKELGLCLPLQILFESPSVEKLALKIDSANAGHCSRLVRLRATGSKSPIFCWPGLGGYTMNLRLLAGKVELDRPFYGVQAHGINPGETPYATIKEMAAQDIKAIRRVQPEGPYTLWGYSFGARVAFETAYQLEQAGERVEHLFLIAPGSPKVRAEDVAQTGREPSYGNPAYVTILFSVFMGSITGPALGECLAVCRDDDSFAAFICARLKHLDPELVKRIVRIVCQTFEFKYAFRELAERQLRAPVSIFKAQGDDYSFIENHSGYSAQAPAVISLAADHYELLKDAGIDELVKVIHHRFLAEGRPELPTGLLALLERSA